MIFSNPNAPHAIELPVIYVSRYPQRVNWHPHTDLTILFYTDVKYDAFLQGGEWYIRLASTLAVL